MVRRACSNYRERLKEAAGSSIDEKFTNIQPVASNTLLSIESAAGAEIGNCAAAAAAALTEDLSLCD